MASTKERARWERWYDAVTARMDQQKRSIDRLVLINTECVAALMEIAAMTEYASILDAQQRAQEALDRVGAASAAAEAESKEESEQDQIEDPRRN